MTERRTEQVPLSSDGGELSLTTAEPESVVRGGIVVVQEARGVTDAVRRLADEFAAEGWLTVVPHLYHRDGVDELAPDSDAEQVRRQVERLSSASVLVDCDGALDWLVARGVTTDQIGVVGSGVGGTVALIVATQRDLGAAVTIGGTGIVAPVSPALPALVEAAPDLRCPWLGIYGGEDLVPEDEVHKLCHAAHSAQVATDLVHFTQDMRRDRSVAVEVWTRTLNWFDSHLR